MKPRILQFILLVGLILPAPTLAQYESDIQALFCQGMRTEVALKTGVRADCLSGTHAIEIDWSHKWAEGVGQAMHYASVTGLKVGIVLVCKLDLSVCLGHRYKAESTLAHYGIKATIWECDRDMQSRADCTAREVGE